MNVRIIWADYAAVGVLALIAMVLGLIFASNDAPLRKAAYAAKAARYHAGCVAPRTSDAAAVEPDATQTPVASNDVAPSALELNQAQLSAQPVIPEQTPEPAGQTPSAGAGELPATNTADQQQIADEPAQPSGQAEPIVTQPAEEVNGQRLPVSLCERLRHEVEEEETAIAAPTLGGLVNDIGKAALYFVAPLWVGLRIVDLKLDGPRHRLKRNAYWQATKETRKRDRRHRRSRSRSRSG